MPTANHDPNAVDVGPGLLFIAPIGTTEPVGIADSEWPSAWIELGYTDAGSVFKIEPTVDEIRVAEERDPVQSVVSSVKSTLDVALAQITAWNFAVAMGGGTIATASGVVTFEPPDAGTEKEVMLGWRSADELEAFLWRRCKTNAALNLDRKPGNTKATIPLQFHILTVAGKKSWKFFGKSPDRSGPAITTIYP